MLKELTYEDPILDVPQNTKIKLKRHQMTVLYAMKQLEESNGNLKTKIGILADKVGSGKSYSSLALILSGKSHLQQVKKLHKTYANDMINITYEDDYASIASNVIVIPHNLCDQWKKYIEAFCPSETKYKLIYKRKQIDNLELTDLTDNDILLVSSTMYSMFSVNNIVESVTFARVFYDEADVIYLPSCRKLNSAFYWFITASYNNMLYPYREYRFDHNIKRYIEMSTGIRTSGFIRTLFTTLVKHQDICLSIIVKNADSYVDESLMLDEIIRNYVTCKTSDIFNILSDHVTMNVMRCLHAHDYKKALEYINPSNKNTEDNIINALVENYKKTLNVNDAKLAYTRTIVYASEEQRERDIKKILDDNEAINKTIENIYKRVADSSCCPICYQEHNMKTVVKCCQNSFCLSCIGKWVSTNNRCPMCNAHTQVSHLYVVQKPEDEVKDECLNKFDQAIKIITDKPDGKFLVLSAYDTSFHNITEQLNGKQISYSYLKGNSGCIANIINKYKTGSNNILLINPKHYGCGLNLENTTDIILFHNLEKDMENQIIGRANRLGRTTPLKVWYLLHENEHKN